MTDNEKKEKNPNSVLSWVRDIVIAIVLAMILLQFVSPTIVRQQSMVDTLNDGDYLFISKQAYRFGELKHGDIVVFTLKENGQEKKLIKRAIALSGDSLEIKDGEVYVNDKKLDEPYTDGQETEGDINTVVPEGKLFVMGDNRTYSRDSRDPTIGFVDEDDLGGEAVFRVFPLGDFGKVE